MVHQDIVVGPKKWDRAASRFSAGGPSGSGSNRRYTRLPRASLRHWITVHGEHVTARRDPLSSPHRAPKRGLPTRLPSTGGRQGRTRRFEPRGWRMVGPYVCVDHLHDSYDAYCHADVSIGTRGEKDPIHVFFRGRIRGSGHLINADKRSFVEPFSSLIRKRA